MIIICVSLLHSRGGWGNPETIIWQSVEFMSDKTSHKETVLCTMDDQVEVAICRANCVWHDRETSTKMVDCRALHATSLTEPVVYEVPLCTRTRIHLLCNFLPFFSPADHSQFAASSEATYDEGKLFCKS